ncbi:unnamed protein product [Coregonus sp. 'balchen']|nr:unnamed protein product [Coregonus sp. 'balchen']
MQLTEQWKERLTSFMKNLREAQPETPRGPGGDEGTWAGPCRSSTSSWAGIHKQLMCLVGVMEFWATRLKALVGHTEGLPHCDCLKLEKALGSWIMLAMESLLYDDVFNTLREFILTQANFFDCENRRLCEEILETYRAMVPDHCDDQEQALLPGPNTTVIMEVSLEQLEKDAKNLSQKLNNFSKYITM